MKRTHQTTAGTLKIETWELDPGESGVVEILTSMNKVNSVSVTCYETEFYAMSATYFISGNRVTVGGNSSHGNVLIIGE